MCSQMPILVRDLTCDTLAFSQCTFEVGAFTTCSDGSTNVVSLECEFARCPSLTRECSGSEPLIVRQSPYFRCAFGECADAVDASVPDNAIAGFWLNDDNLLMYEGGAVCGQGFVTEYAEALCVGLGLSFGVEMWERGQYLKSGYYAASDIYCPDAMLNQCRFENGLGKYDSCEYGFQDAVKIVCKTAVDMGDIDYEEVTYEGDCLRGTVRGYKSGSWKRDTCNEELNTMVMCTESGVVQEVKFDGDSCSGNYTIIEETENSLCTESDMGRMSSITVWEGGCFAPSMSPSTSSPVASPSLSPTFMRWVVEFSQMIALGDGGECSRFITPTLEATYATTLDVDPVRVNTFAECDETRRRLVDSSLYRTTISVEDESAGESLISSINVADFQTAVVASLEESGLDVVINSTSAFVVMQASFVDNPTKTPTFAPTVTAIPVTLPPEEDLSNEEATIGVWWIIAIIMAVILCVQCIAFAYVCGQNRVHSQNNAKLQQTEGMEMAKRDQDSTATSAPKSAPPPLRMMVTPPITDDMKKKPSRGGETLDSPTSPMLNIPSAGGNDMDKNFSTSVMEVAEGSLPASFYDANKKEEKRDPANSPRAQKQPIGEVNSGSNI